jgi:hypothetical protein
MELLAVDLGKRLFGRTDHFLNNEQGLGTLVSVFLSNATVAAGIILVFIIIFTGYGMISAGGDKQKFQNSSKLITYGIAGFLIVFAAFLIVRVIEAITAVPIFGK